MKFDNLSNLNEIYDCFVENNQHFNFENLDRAMDEYEKYILSIDGLKADVAQELHSRALLL